MWMLKACYACDSLMACREPLCTRNWYRTGSFWCKCGKMNSITGTKCGAQGNTGEPDQCFGKSMYIHSFGKKFRKKEKYGISNNTFLVKVQIVGK